MSSDKNTENNSTDLILNQLREIASAVLYAAEARTLEQVLERIAQVSADLVHARYAALGVPDGKDGLRYFKVAGMSPEQVRRMGHLPLGRGLLGAVMKERKPLRLERMADDSRSSGFCDNHPTMTSFLGVPIQAGQQLFGLLYLSDRLDGQPFSARDQELIETMAGYAALAIAGAQLSEQQNRLNLLEERDRIGMELHDGVIQSLYAIGMHLDLMRLSGGANPDDLSQTIMNLNQVIEDIRRYIMDLQSSDHRHKTIHERLTDMLDRLHLPESLQIELDAPHEKPYFTPAAFEAICQMANEAISNAVRHAEAQRIIITATQDKTSFRIVIHDDGQGFNPNDLSTSSGLGLRNIQQRAALHNGQVQIESSPGGGTRLTIIIPVRNF